MEKIVIFGAKSMALGIYRAIHTLHHDCCIEGFLVSTRQGNPPTLAGLPVWELSSFHERNVCVLIATPEDTHAEIVKMLEKHGFRSYICINSEKESTLMEQYYGRIGMFLPLHRESEVLRVYTAKCYKDKPLQNPYFMPEWCTPIQAGAALTDVRVADLLDIMGDNISGKNPNYCELTVLYWIWRNRLLLKNPAKAADYYGLFHYRRLLQVNDEDIRRLGSKQVDVILPYPTLHEPDIREHHKRYIKETDWEAMLQALSELAPEYAAAFAEIQMQPYLYNYNILIATVEVLRTYCAWLFPILSRTEELSMPHGWERADRYIGYLGENLLTLYFMYHQKDLNIVHTGHIMLT